MRSPVADELGIARVVFPRERQHAVGLRHPALQSRRTTWCARRCCAAVPESLPTFARHGRACCAEAQARLDADGVPAADRQIELAADMRYKGQAFELTVPARATRARREPRSTGLIAGFHAHPPPALLLCQPGRAGGDRLAARGRHRPPARSRGRPATRRRWASGSLPAPQGLAGWRLARDRRLAPRADRCATPIAGPARDRGGLHDRAAGRRLDLRARDESGHLIAERAATSRMS